MQEDSNYDYKVRIMCTAPTAMHRPKWKCHHPTQRSPSAPYAPPATIPSPYIRQARALHHTDRTVRAIAVEPWDFSDEPYYIEFVENQFAHPQRLRIPHGTSRTGRYNAHSATELTSIHQRPQPGPHPPTPLAQGRRYTSHKTQKVAQAPTSIAPSTHLGTPH